MVSDLVKKLREYKRLYDEAKENENHNSDTALLSSVENYLDEVKVYNSNRASSAVNVNGKMIDEHKAGINSTKALIIDLLKKREYLPDLKKEFPEILCLEHWEEYLKLSS